MSMKKALILGYGVSGKGSAKMLVNLGYKVYFFDEYTTCGEYVNLYGRDMWEEMQDIDLVVVSPSFDMSHNVVELARKCGVEVIGEIELGYRNCGDNIIAITGTNGKTTTTMLVNHILKCAGFDSRAVGNIGQSFCSELADSDQDADYYVLEVSSYQLESVSHFKPHIAVCLNISADHLARHKTLLAYQNIKKKIFLRQQQNDFAILGYDNEIVRDFSSSMKGNVYYFSTKHRVRGAYINNDKVFFLDQDSEQVCNTKELGITAEYNLQNVLASIVVAKLLGIANNTIVKAIASFKMPRFRNEYIGNIRGINFYNDSKATNFDSTISACKSLGGDIALIVGGYDKGISYQSFFDVLPTNVKHIVACGGNVNTIMEFLPEQRSFGFERTSSLDRAVRLAYEKGCDNVLFSPTTSSFDRYSNYEERGRDFDRCFKELSSEEKQ